MAGIAGTVEVVGESVRRNSGSHIRNNEKGAWLEARLTAETSSDKSKNTRYNLTSGRGSCVLPLSVGS